MRKILILLFLVLISCNNSLDKSVFTPLSLEELNKEIKNDSNFQYVYDAIRTISDEKITSPSEKAKYFDITYERVNEFAEFANDTNLVDKNKYRNRWVKSYSKDYNYFDSIINLAKNFRTNDFIKTDLGKKVGISALIYADPNTDYELKDFYKSDILGRLNIKELCSENEFYAKIRDSIVKVHDPLCFEFFNKF